MYRRLAAVGFTVLRQLTSKQLRTKHYGNGINYQVFVHDNFYLSISPRQFATTTEIPRENLEKVHFNEFKHLLNDKNVVVIDVREPEELKELGTLPKSINIPLGEVEEALKLSNECFLQKYGQNKPQKATPIIFSCMRGRRSETAQIKALQLEYKNVKNYVGGWEEWAEKNKKE